MGDPPPWVMGDPLSIPSSYLELAQLRSAHPSLRFALLARVIGCARLQVSDRCGKLRNEMRIR